MIRLKGDSNPPTGCDGFAGLLVAMLRRRNGGRLPEIAALTCLFNESIRWEDPISSDTFRRSVRGHSVPEVHRFAQLCAFLECAPEALMPGSRDPARAAKGLAAKAALIEKIADLPGEEALALCRVLGVLVPTSVAAAGGGQAATLSPPPPPL